jgi:hypothetical protein
VGPYILLVDLALLAVAICQLILEASKHKQNHLPAAIRIRGSKNIKMTDNVVRGMPFADIEDSADIAAQRNKADLHPGSTLRIFGWFSLLLVSLAVLSLNLHIVHF